MGNCMNDNPTAGDYAWGTAQESRRLIKELRAQVAELRRAAGLPDEVPPPKPAATSYASAMSKVYGEKLAGAFLGAKDG